MSRIKWALLVVVLVLVAAGGAAWHFGYLPVRAAACEQHGGDKVVWVGDSYPAGQGVSAEEGYACQTAESLDWDLTLDAQGSTGFVSDGHVRNRWFEPLGARLPETVENAGDDVDLVVVDAGRNDATFEPDTVKERATTYLERVREAWPEARIVVVMPWLLAGAEQPAQLAAAVRSAATSVDAEVLDPEREGWVTDELREATLSDRIHPTVGAHEVLAEKFEGALG